MASTPRHSVACAALVAEAAAFFSRRVPFLLVGKGAFLGISIMGITMVSYLGFSVSGRFELWVEH